MFSGLTEEGKVIGWFNGPMEFGPRALGWRSIIGDPRNQKMQSLMNLQHLTSFSISVMLKPFLVIMM